MNSATNQSFMRFLNTVVRSLVQQETAVTKHKELKFRTATFVIIRQTTWVKEQCKLDIRKYAFCQLTIIEWNNLPVDCVNT